MATEIDSLQVKVSANAQSAVKSLNALSRALSKVKKSLESVKSSGQIKEAVKDVMGESSGEVSKGEQRVRTLDKIGASLKNLRKRFHDVSEKIKDALGGSNKFFASLKRIAFYRAIRAALKAIGEAFETGLKNAYYYAKQTGDLSNLAKTLDEVKSKTSQMVNQLGAFWGEIKQLVAPAIEWIAEQITKITAYLTELFAALNGDTYYQRAKLVAKSWDDAADAADKYRHQLLGIDELNNLSKKNDSGKSAVASAKEEFEDILVRPEFQAVGKAWRSVKETISKAIDDIENIVIGGLIGIGAVLLFSGANVPLGLAMLAGGTYMGVKKIIENWDSISGDIKQVLGTIGEIVGGALVGIGAVLAFSGANVPLGLGMIVAGAGVFHAAALTLHWDKMDKKMQNKVAAIASIVGGALLAVGSILAFSGANLPLGIGLMAAGALSVGTAAVLKWTTLSKDVKKRISKITAIASGATLAIGAILALSGVNIPLGIALLTVGATGLVATGILNWDSILGSLQGAWKSIKEWWNTKVYPKISKAVETVAGLFSGLFKGIKSFFEGIAEATGDAIAGDIEVPLFKPAISYDFTGGKEPEYPKQLKPGDVPSMTVNGVTYDTSSKKTKALDYKWDKLKDSINENIGIKLDAMGAINRPGTLFYAGEAGPEYIGSMGGSSAVANTGQMTDAIYKAAYMGMSRALKESGGMNGFEPATTDDLFIAMKKKSSAYTKRTGESAFA